MFSSPKSLFRVFAIAEVCTWALLITALIVRALTDFPLGVSVAGGIHGFVFLCYGATAILVSLNNRWRPAPTVLAVGSAVIPFATVPVELWLDRRGLLDGAWRREESDDPRDRRWIDRALRFFLRRPWLFAAILAAAVVVVFVVLLLIGPPGGRH